MKNPKKLIKYLQSKDLEIRVKKTVIGIYYDNLQLFSITNIKEDADGDFIVRFTFNILKQNKKVFKKIDDIVDTEKTPFIKQIYVDDLISILKTYKLVKKSKKLTVFNEVQTDYTLSTATNKEGKIVEYRSNLPTEQHIVDAVFKSNEYVNKGLRLNSDDIVLDLGGNIGCFSCEIFDRVDKVIAFEPEDVNFNFLKRNLKLNKAKNVEVHKAAVVGNKDEARNLYLGKVPYYYSFLVTNNRKPVEVKCMNINDIIKQYKPTKLKIDIEGSELEVMMGIKNFRNVEQIIFEYNFDMNKDLKNDYENFNALKSHLKNNGFDISDMEKDLKQNWNMVFLVNRK